MHCRYLPLKFIHSWINKECNLSRVASSKITFLRRLLSRALSFSIFPDVSFLFLFTANLNYCHCNGQHYSWVIYRALAIYSRLQNALPPWTVILKPIANLKLLCSFRVTNEVTFPTWAFVWQVSFIFPLARTVKVL